VAEGAIDESGASIKCYDVKKIIEAATGADTRETILGHVQRGGAPSALDRYISTILGVRAVEVVLEAKEGFIPVMVGTVGGKTIETDLSECVRNTRRVATEMAKKDYEAAFALRDYCFKESFKLVQVLSSTADAYPPPTKSKTIAILHVGSPCPGMNAAVRAAARMAISKGYIPFLFYNGFTGVANADGFICTWRGVANWAHQGGAHLGSNREIPSKVGFQPIADTLAKYHINGLVIIGGWTSYISAKELYENSNQYPQFKIPIVCVPASIGNNCPGTNMSIGSDTALNVIVNTSDAIKCSGLSSRRRIFIVEVMGSYSGYLALAGGISAGAHLCYTPEKGIALEQVLEDIKKMKTRFSTCLSTSLILNGENASDVYTTNMLKELFQEESEEMYDVRMLILGHVQQGNLPSPQDRIFASLLGSHAVSILEDKIENLKDTWYGSIGIDEYGLKESPFNEIEPNMDFKRKVAVDSWWKEYFPVMISSLQQCSESQKFRPLHEATTSHLFQESPSAEMTRTYSLKRDHVVEIFSGEHTHLHDLNAIPANVEVKDDSLPLKNKPRRPWAALTLSGPRAEQQQRYKHSNPSIKMIKRDGVEKSDGPNGKKKEENGERKENGEKKENGDAKPLVRESSKKKKESRKNVEFKNDVSTVSSGPTTVQGGGSNPQPTTTTTTTDYVSDLHHTHSHGRGTSSPHPHSHSHHSQGPPDADHFWVQININNLLVGFSLVALGCSLGYMFNRK
jgi:6-phosphofructokinase